MSYEFLQHTADIRMRVWADSLEELFGEALKGMTEFYVNQESVPEKNQTQRREIAINSIDKTALLVDFLNEILAMSQINKEIYDSVSFLKFSETSLRADLEGYKVGDFKRDIKAITYHEANIKENEKGQWETTLVFDI